VYAEAVGAALAGAMNLIELARTARVMPLGPRR
jgi:hypothetical protein